MIVYGREARLPLSLDLSSLDLAHQMELEGNDVIIVRFVELEETRNKFMQVKETHQA
jgi:hypothetical protein